MIKDLYFKFIKKNKKYFLLYLITLLYIPINKVFLPKYYGQFITLLNNKKFSKITTVFIYLIFSWITIQILNTSASYLGSILIPKFKQYIRKFLITEILNRYKANYEEIKLGDLITKIIKTPYILEDVFYTFKDYLIKNIIIILSIFFYLTYYHFHLGLLFAGFMFLIVFITFKYIESCKGHFKKIEILYDKTHEEIEDTFSNLLSIYAFKNYKYEKQRLTNIDNSLYENNLKLNKCKNKFRIIYTIIFIIIILLLNYYSYKLYLKKKLNSETLISVVIINYSLLDISIGFYYETTEFMHTTININLLLNYLKHILPKKIKSQKTLINSNKYKYGLEIEINNLKYKYNYSKTPSLIDINLVIKPNENIIIKGNIGSGKSTLCKLIMKYLVGYEGDIKINGISNKKLNIENLRSHIIYIPQHPNLFNRTLYENLMYGVDKKYTIDDILNKLEDVNLLDIKNKFKKQLNKSVGKLGNRLSGGQRQIVWILRSLFSNSKMVILDEPTSSLDYSTKMKIMNLLEEVSKTRNLIIITHDEDVINYNLHNKIIVMKKGKISKVIKNLENK